MAPALDDFERLTERFRACVGASPTSRIDVLVDLECLGDLRSVGFLLQVLANPDEDSEVRIHALKWLRCSQCTAADWRQHIAGALGQIATDCVNPAVRLHAVLALADFTDLDGVPATLGRITLDGDEPDDLRYCAFTSLERAGLTPECRAVLCRLTADTVLGPCARAALQLWRTT